MIGIVLTNRQLVIRIVNALERRFPDAEACTDEGEGIHETRDEFRWKCKHVFVRFHLDGTQAALILDAGARSRLAAFRTAISPKIAAGTASQLETAVYALPAETTLDASWDAVAPPIGA